MDQDYRQSLASLDNWDEYLKSESRLPGPRANLELAAVVAEEGDADRFNHLLSYGPENAPTNSPEEFLACCGVLGLGKLLADGDLNELDRLRTYASDPRWRIREMVAKALQRYGQKDMPALINEMNSWSSGSFLEQRAAAASLCEPGLIANRVHAEAVLDILDSITVSITESGNRKTEEFKILRKGMAYCWSVAVAAYPDYGKDVMESWLDTQDKDIRWIMKQNLKKKRLLRMDADWVARALKRMDKGA